MFAIKFILVLFILREGSSDWISEWMQPVQSELTQKSSRRDVDIFDPENPVYQHYSPKNIGTEEHFENPINSVPNVFQTSVNKKLKGYDYNKDNTDDIESESIKEYKPMTYHNSKVINENIGGKENYEQNDENSHVKGGLDFSNTVISKSLGVGTVEIDMLDRHGQDWTGAGAMENIARKTIVPGESSMTKLKRKLEQTLANAKLLIQGIKSQIQMVAQRESALKNAIFNGRQGVTVVSVSPLNQKPRQYVVQDGIWTLCNGILQQPFTGNQAPDTPHCTGRWLSSNRDPCVFNSMIKYETVPTYRRAEYVEDEFVCLRSSFNNTLERYLSVPRSIVNQTCTDGEVRALDENIEKCGHRVMTDYTFYPYKEGLSVKTLPLEYCTEPGGTCKLIVAWHLMNGSIEHFEFLKDEVEFKKFFIKTDFINGLNIV